MKRAGADFLAGRTHCVGVDLARGPDLECWVEMHLDENGRLVVDRIVRVMPRLKPMKGCCDERS